MEARPPLAWTTAAIACHPAACPSWKELAAPRYERAVMEMLTPSMITSPSGEARWR